MNDITPPVCLDDKRDWHPDRAARLKAAPPAPHEEMQRLMRQVHQDRDLRAAFVARARTQLGDQAAACRKMHKPPQRLQATAIQCVRSLTRAASALPDRES
jgi:hypothetical protein